MRNLIIFILVAIVLIVANYAGYRYFLAEKSPETSQETQIDDDENDSEVISQSPTNSVERVVSSNAETKILNEKLRVAGIYKEIDDKKVAGVTILAPSDVVFAQNSDKLSTLSTAENKAMLRNLIILETLSPEKLVELNGQQVETLGGEMLTITISSGIVEFEDTKGNTVRLIKPTPQPSGSYVYLIDGVFEI